LRGSSDEASNRAFTGPAAVRYDKWFDTSGGRYAWEKERRVLAGLCGDITGKRVLDVGCGSGIQILLYRSLGAEVTGADPSPDMVALTAERTPGVPLIIAKGESLPFADDTFELVSIITVLDFCDDPAALLREARRVTRGRIIIAVLNAWSVQGLISRLKELARVKSSVPKHRFCPRALRELLYRVFGRVNLIMTSTLFLFPFMATRGRRFSGFIDRRLTGKSLAGAFLAVEVQTIEGG
jgi:ubiquinone/menaquinone biosynthesis C-methylase UbiE